MGIYLAIFGAVLSTVVIPLPEEATLLAAGYAARLGRATLVGCVAAAWAAVLLGDIVTFWVGRAFFARVLRTRIGGALFPEDRRRWAEQFIARHGERAIVVARFLVGLRGLVHLAIGASRFPLLRFAVIDACVGFIEVGLLVGIGYEFGELRTRVGARIDVFLATILCLALFGPLAVRWLLRRRLRKEGGGLSAR